MRVVTADDIDALALGAAVLGTGGGGDPYIGKLMAVQAMRLHGAVQMIDLDELADDDLVVPVAMMGAPTVMMEKLPRGDEITGALHGLQQYLGRPVHAVTPIEAGGLNSTTPFLVASTLGLPLVDADGMRRAFPELQMVTPTLFGLSATPLAIGDDKGNSAIIETVDNGWTERLARTLTIHMGGMGMVALYPMTGAEARRALLSGSVSLAIEIGRTIYQARHDKRDAVRAVVEVTGGRRLFTGKVTDVDRRTERGFARGEARISGLDADDGTSLLIRFQNENLIALRDGAVVATVPDLITVLDAETADPVTTEALRYGLRVAVIAMPSAEIWRTEAGLGLVGPRVFGYDVAYRPVDG